MRKPCASAMRMSGMENALKGGGLGSVACGCGLWLVLLVVVGVVGGCDDVICMFARIGRIAELQRLQV